MNEYRPGSHIIATLESEHHSKLNTFSLFRDFLESLIASHRLQQLGTVYHDFSPGGFTAVVCLSESHISIHTWPEYNKVNLDIYLSNYLRENDGTVTAIFDEVTNFFEATIVQQQKIVR